MGTPGEAESFQTIDIEISDFRAAMRHLIDRRKYNDAAAIAIVLGDYWFARHLGWEATNWFDEILSRRLKNEVRVRTLCAAGWAAYTRADYPVARDRYMEARDLSVSVGDRQGEGNAWYGLARVEGLGDPEVWKPVLEKAIEVYASVGDEAGLTRCYAWLGLDACNRGERAEGERLYAKVIEYSERQGWLRSVSMAHSYLSLAAMLDDDEVSSRNHIARAEAIARRAEEIPALYGALHQRALTEARWGSPEIAASGLIEALEGTPLAHSNYILMYLGHALGIMIRLKDWDRAAILIATIDRTYEKNGWPPIASRRKAHALFHEQIAEHVPIPDIPDSTLPSVAEVRDDVLGYLRSIRD